MHYRTLGDSDLDISTVIFGAWAIGGWKWGGTDDDDAVTAIQAAIDAGVTTIDTAPAYGFGHSERIVGQAIRGRRDEVLIATKCGLRWDGGPEGAHMKTHDRDGRELYIHRDLSRESILREVDQSLERLGVDAIDLYQCHWPDEKTPIEETMGALEECRRRGKIRATGVSNFSTGQMAESCRHADIASDQPRYNMLQREAELDVLPFCREHGLGVICYSPLAQGILTGKVSMDREFEGDDVRNKNPLYRSGNRRRALDLLEQLRPIAEGYGKTLAQLAINWTIHRPGVTAAIVGARRPEQVRENAGGAGWQLEHADQDRVTAILDEMGYAPGN
jgi:aryl-alcohol dehydrogenase-like predicted oxidoreductase